MLVYANHLTFQGSGTEEAIFKAIGGWLKEQLGFGLRPDQLRQDGEFSGCGDDARFSLRIRATGEEEPKLYAWVLKNPDETVWGRQWITELGLRSYGGILEVSCVVKTDELSTLVASPVMVSRPRVIGYLIDNVQQAVGAGVTTSLPGVSVKFAGRDKDSYRGLLAEIERPDRDYPIVLLSPTRDGRYLLNAADLQQQLVGLGQVVQLSPDFNSYDMAEVLGHSQSAWGGAVNILYMPTRTGVVRSRRFRLDEILSWGDIQHDRISRLLAWTTNNTNIPRLRQHVRPEGVVQLALRRRMQTARANSDWMNAAPWRMEPEEEAARRCSELGRLVEDNSRLEATISEFKAELADAKDELAKKESYLQALRGQLAKAGGGRGNFVGETLLASVYRTGPLSPAERNELIGSLPGDTCVVPANASIQ
jgi:hypothetical protein